MEQDPLKVKAANDCVEEELCGAYNCYDPELPAKYTASSGNKLASYAGLLEKVGGCKRMRQQLPDFL